MLFVNILGGHGEGERRHQPCGRLHLPVGRLRHPCSEASCAAARGGVDRGRRVWIIVAAASEIIALTPLKSNSVIQLVLQAIEAIKPTKKI